MIAQQEKDKLTTMIYVTVANLRSEIRNTMKDPDDRTTQAAALLDTLAGLDAGANGIRLKDMKSYKARND